MCPHGSWCLSNHSKFIAFVPSIGLLPWDGCPIGGVSRTTNFSCSEWFYTSNSHIMSQHKEYSLPFEQGCLMSFHQNIFLLLFICISLHSSLFYLWPAFQNSVKHLLLLSNRHASKTINNSFQRHMLLWSSRHVIITCQHKAMHQHARLWCTSFNDAAVDFCPFTLIVYQILSSLLL